MPTPYTKNTWLDDDTRYPLSAARMAIIEQGIYDAHYRPTVKAYMNANATLASGVQTRLTLGAEVWDTDTMHDTVTNPGRITIKTAGTYIVTARAAFQRVATANSWFMYLIHSTAGIILQRYTPAQASNVYAPFTYGSGTQQGWLFTASMTRRFAANDYFELALMQNTGVAIGVPALGDWCPAVEATLVAY